ncbi:MAG: hypothetical protein AAGJ69_11495 [Cyanobacteria bacterium J06559_1]
MKKRTAALGLALIVLGLSAKDTLAVSPRQSSAAIQLAAGPLDTRALDEISEEERENDTPTEETLEDALPPRPYAPLRPFTTCPADIETLTALIIRDIPNYTNRVLQRSVAALPGNDVDGRAPYRPSNVLIAGRPELEPLDLNEYALTTDPAAGGPLTQLFFTTLSRQYSGLRFNEVQEYHWLFLTRASDGWRLAFMFSTVDDAASIRAPLPPRESSEGSVGKAVQLWLRDCRAGAIYALEDSKL